MLVREAHVTVQLIRQDQVLARCTSRAKAAEGAGVRVGMAQGGLQMHSDSKDSEFRTGLQRFLSMSSFTGHGEERILAQRVAGMKA